MTQSIDNSEWVMPGVIRDPITGALMRVNADGSINVSIAGGAGAGTGFTTASTAGSVLVGTNGTNGLSLGVPAWLTAAAGGGAGTGFTSTTTAGTAVVGTLNSNGLSVGIPAYLTTAGTAANSNNMGLNTAGTNITWTANSSGLSINAAGYAGTGTTFTNVTATLNSVGLQLNASGYAGTVTGASGNLSITANSSGISVSQPALVTISNFAPLPYVNSTNITLPGTSVSHAVSFNLPEYGSFSFLRLPSLQTTTLVSNYSSANTMTTGAAFQYSTWNAVFYSVGVGASSQSLQYYTSGSGGQTQVNSYSFSSANSAWSVTQVFTYLVTGLSTVTVSTQYSQTTASLNWSTGVFSNVSGGRWLDIPLAASFSPGNYWLVLGLSSSSTTSGQVNAAQMANLAWNSFSAIRFVSLNNNAYNVMGDNGYTGGALFGAGSYSTAGGGTTNSINVSNISSSASNIKLYFEMCRSA